MYKVGSYPATVEQLRDIYELPEDKALQQSDVLIVTHTAIVAYYALRSLYYPDPGAAEQGLDTKRIAHELDLKLVDEPPADPSYVIGPYCIVNEATVIRGIAIWQPNPKLAVA